VLCGGVGVAGVLVLRWSRGRDGRSPPAAPVDSALAARIDSDLAGFE
jgi:hypothetical protein